MTNLDPHQIQKRVFDEPSQALRTTLADTNLTISHLDDSIVTYSSTEAYIIDAGIVYGSNEVIEILPEAKNFSSYVPYIKGDGNGIGVIHIDLSPVDDGDVWTNGPTVDLTENTSGVLIIKSSVSITARRLRIRAGAAGADTTGVELFFVWRG